MKNQLLLLLISVKFSRLFTAGDIVPDIETCVELIVDDVRGIVVGISEVIVVEVEVVVVVVVVVVEVVAVVDVLEN